MKIVSVSENLDIEKRIAITPEISKKYISLGFEVFLSENYGDHLGIKDKEYLNTNYRYGYPGGQAVMVYKIHSLDQDNFLVPVFEKSIEVYRETHRDYNNTPVNFIFERNVDIKLKKGIEFEISLKISYCPEIEDEKCETLFEESHIDFYKIN